MGKSKRPASPERESHGLKALLDRKAPNVAPEPMV